MKQLAPGAWRLKELPLPTVNVYLVDGIPLACHADDVEAMEGRRPLQEAHWPSSSAS